MMAPLCCSLSLSDRRPVFYQMLNTAVEGSSIPAPIHHTLPHTHTPHSTDPLRCFVFYSKGHTGDLTHAGWIMQWGKYFWTWRKKCADTLQGPFWDTWSNWLLHSSHRTWLLGEKIPNSFHVQRNNYFHPVTLIRIWLQSFTFCTFYNLLQKNSCVCMCVCVMYSSHRVGRHSAWLWHQWCSLCESVWSQHDLIRNPRDNTRSGLWPYYTYLHIFHSCDNRELERQRR